MVGGRILIVQKEIGGESDTRPAHAHVSGKSFGSEIADAEYGIREVRPDLCEADELRYG